MLHRVPKADVTVVGAGPAGAMTAYYLALRGLRVHLIEKRTFPRDKPCGGGLTGRARRQIPFDLAAVVEDAGRSIRLTFGRRLLLEQRSASPPILLVRRDRFDALLVEEAVRAGAVFQEDTAFQHLSGPPGNLEIATTRRPLRSRVIVGADGAQSRVRTALGCCPQVRSMVALEARVQPDQFLSSVRCRGRIDFDYSASGAGYGWVFPKKDHLSVGVFSSRSHPGAMKKRFFEYLRSKGLQNGEIAGLRGGRIPWSTGRHFRPCDDRGLLVGDAAGLCDPITGEGIYAAALQARLAAEAICERFAGKTELCAYNRAVQSAFAADNVCARWMRVFLYRFPGPSRRCLSLRRGYLLKRYLAVAAGDARYRDEFSPLVLLGRLCGLHRTR